MQLTHRDALAMHRACLRALQHLDLVADGLTMPIGTHACEEKELDQMEADAWAVSAHLLGIRGEHVQQTIGGHQAAIYAHQDALDGDRWKREEMEYSDLDHRVEVEQREREAEAIRESSAPQARGEVPR